MIDVVRKSSSSELVFVRDLFVQKLTEIALTHLVGRYIPEIELFAWYLQVIRRGVEEGLVPYNRPGNCDTRSVVQLPGFCSFKELPGAQRRVLMPEQGAAVELIGP